MREIFLDSTLKLTT